MMGTHIKRLFAWLSVLLSFLFLPTLQTPSSRKEGNILMGPEFSWPTAAQELEEESIDENILATERINDLFMIDATTEGELGWKEFIEKSKNLALGLQELGCTNNSMVGIVSENRLEYPIVYLGTFLTGSTLTMFDATLVPDELIRLYNISKPRIVFCPVEHCLKLRSVCESCTFVVFEPGRASSVPNAVHFSQLIKPSSKRYTPVKNLPDDVAFVLYSSGTTGFPKGIMTTHRNIVYIMKLIREKQIMEHIGGTFVSDRSMGHGLGVVVFLVQIVRNQTLIIMPKTEEPKHDEKLYLSAIQTHKIKQIITAPATVIFMLKNPIADAYDLTSLESIMCTSAPLKYETEQAVIQKFGLKGIIQWWGTTEIGIATYRDLETAKPGSVGKVVPLIQVKVVDRNTGKALGVHQRGEIYVKGPNVTKGYMRNEKESAEVYGADGWFHTGDIGYYDEDGDFFIVDRIREVIKYKGYHASPAELEATLLTHPEVADCAAIGIPDEAYGEVPRAYVVKKPKAKITEEDIIKFVGENTSTYKHLKGGVEFVTTIPKNANGKILRRVLRETWVASQSTSQSSESSERFG